jgi:hyperosmotically inducible protein
MRDTKRLRWVLVLAVLTLGVSAASAQAPAPPPSQAALEDSVRNAILRLPYYGVFDLISFQVEGTKITLGGYVYRAILQEEAEKAVKKIPGVTQVVNKIEILPVSIEDDRIRWAAFRAIYTDAFLSHYGTPVGGPWAGRGIWGPRFGSWPGFRTGPWSGAPFLGMEPIGNYAIHIIVKAGIVSLYGVVNNEAERTKAEMDARQIFGVRGVNNYIQVEKER